jgi:hypothetical protein
MMVKKQKVPVTERALIQRINRKLHDDDQMVKTTRGGRAEMDLGRHYVLNWRINGVVHTNIDLEDLGRELGVLQDWEGLAT